MRLLTLETCPVTEKYDRYSTENAQDGTVGNRDSSTTATGEDQTHPPWRPLQNEALYAFCAALMACDVDVRSVVAPFGWR